MAIFHCYVSSPEGKSRHLNLMGHVGATLLHFSFDRKQVAPELTCPGDSGHPQQRCLAPSRRSHHKLCLKQNTKEHQAGRYSKNVMWKPPKKKQDHHTFCGINPPKAEVSCWVYHITQKLHKIFGLRSPIRRTH